MQDSIFNLLTEEQLRGRNTLKWNYFGPDVVPLWLAEMDFPTAPAVLDGVRACVDNEEFGYPPWARTACRGRRPIGADNATVGAPDRTGSASCRMS